MQYDTLCISCFQDKGTENDCPHCGYVESGNRKQSVLPPRTVLNERYVLGEILSTDKNNVCYKALDTDKKCIVEVQEYFPRDAVSRDGESMQLMPVSDDLIEKFQKSVQTIEQNAVTMQAFSDSDNIIHIYDSFQANGTVYIVQEYLEGLLLDDYIKQCDGALDLDTSLSVMMAVLDGLGQIHKQGLVHRAVTPKNIILTTDNKIKIINFTFLKEASPYKESEMTVYFFPGYAPYEQYVSKEKRGAYSDIYSAGAVLYKMLMGQTPPDAIGRKTEDTLREKLEANGVDLPRHVILSICKAMNQDKELRFKSVADFKNALLQKQEVVDMESEISDRRAKKDNRAVIALLGLLVVLVGVLVFVIRKFWP